MCLLWVVDTCSHELPGLMNHLEAPPRSFHLSILDTVFQDVQGVSNSLRNDVVNSFILLRVINWPFPPSSTSCESILVLVNVTEELRLILSAPKSLNPRLNLWVIMVFARLKNNSYLFLSLSLRLGVSWFMVGGTAVLQSKPLSCSRGTNQVCLLSLWRDSNKY